MTRSTTRPISIAIMALGGQGGGVMADWTVKVAELAGFRAQYTSVQGVAQRTGATVYYIELFPEAEIAAQRREPVLALMPVPGDVDIVVASELMEAGRAIMRGFVTPDRTTLIASTHRVYAISEKIAMADGRADSQVVHEEAKAHARRWICFDMEQTAREGGSVISAAMLGALAGSGALPIPREVYETVIRQSGKAVEANLRTFALGFERARGEKLPDAPIAAGHAAQTPPAPVRPLLERIETEVPFVARAFAIEGLRRTIDYQDLAYGTCYLDRLREIIARDAQANGSAHRHELVRETARYLALWMTFEDTFRVADLKTRGTRFERFRQEVNAVPDQIVAVTEFMHPRLQEVADSLPEPLGRWVARQSWLERFFSKGRKLRTTSLGGFLLLSLLASGRRWRRKTLRFRREDAAIREWLDLVLRLAGRNYAAAVELVRCQKLIRGYGETRERGTHNFSKIMAAIKAAPERIPASAIRRLREAALVDEQGAALEAALAELA